MLETLSKLKMMLNQAIVVNADKNLPWVTVHVSRAKYAYLYSREKSFIGIVDRKRKLLQHFIWVEEKYFLSRQKVPLKCVAVCFLALYGWMI